MKVSVMESEIFSSSNINDIQNSSDLQTALAKLSQIVAQNYQAHISFCKLFGKRWSHFAGSEATYAVKKRARINKSFGILYAKNSLTGEQLNQMIKLSQKLINNFS